MLYKLANSFFLQWDFFFGTEEVFQLEFRKIKKNVVWWGFYNHVVGLNLPNRWIKGSSINNVKQFPMIFNTPSPIVTLFCNKASLLLSQDPWYPLPPKTVTSFMDGPEWQFLSRILIFLSFTFLFTKFVGQIEGNKLEWNIVWRFSKSRWLGNKDYIWNGRKITNCHF